MRASICLLAIALAGCTTWGYKSRTGNLYPPNDWQLVKVLWSPPPAGTYEEVGMCSVLGGAAFITSDVDMFNKLRKAAADLGADAVIVIREGSSRAAWASGVRFMEPLWRIRQRQQLVIRLPKELRNRHQMAEAILTLYLSFMKEDHAGRILGTETSCSPAASFARSQRLGRMATTQVT